MKEYDVTINGLLHRMQLSDEDAERLGVKPAEDKRAKIVEPPRQAEQPRGHNRARGK